MNSIIDQQRQDREFTCGCSDNAYVPKSNCDDWHVPDGSLEYLHELDRIEFDISKEELSHIQTPIGYIEFKIMD